MKKLSEKRRLNFIKKARRGNRRAYRKVVMKSRKFKPFWVELWDGVRVEQALCHSPKEFPPSKLCFEENLDGTLEFLRGLRSKVVGVRKGEKEPPPFIERNRKGIAMIRGFMTFEDIEVMSMSMAVVLAAVYYRGWQAARKAPHAVNFAAWSPSAFQTLYELGFFEIIGHSPAERITEVYNEKLNTTYKVAKILSGKNADELEQASNVILELLKYLQLEQVKSDELITDINSAVSEAMINVARHAYPEGFVEASAYKCVEKWWFSASADKSSNTLSIVIYDQGASIPGTLPHQTWYKETIESLMRQIVPNFDADTRQRTIDHEYINYSMKEGKTQTGDARRGLGLPQMQSLIDTCPDGTLSILSRQGLYKYGRKLGVFKQALDIELEGTLIEWHITLPQGV